MGQEFHVSTVPFGDPETGQRAVAIVFSGLGVAFCYDAAQARAAIEAFSDILDEDGKKKLSDFFDREFEKPDYELPQSYPEGAELEVRRDLVGKLFATVLSRNAQFQEAFEILEKQNTGGQIN